MSLLTSLHVLFKSASRFVPETQHEDDILKGTAHLSSVSAITGTTVSSEVM